MGAAGKQVLLLWNVDHTLIENSGVSKAVYARAFEMMTGRAPQVQPGTDGCTDYEIVRNLFTANGAVFAADDETSTTAFTSGSASTRSSSPILSAASSPT